MLDLSVIQWKFQYHFARILVFDGLKEALAVKVLTLKAELSAYAVK